MSATINGLRAPHWRVLNHLRNCAIHGRNASALGLLADQGATLDHLVALEEAGLIMAGLAGIEVTLAGDLDPAALSPRVLVYLTPAGVTKVTTSAFNLVIRVLADVGRARQVQHVRHEAAVDDAVLIAMDDQGLICGCGVDHEPVPLHMFRRVPASLMLHLTSTGRRYAAR